MPENGKLLKFDHIKFWVGNAKQAAQWYCIQFGFEPLAYSGLETGNRQIASHAIRQNQITFVFESQLSPDNEEFGKHLAKHGDCVKDIAFEVENLRNVFQQAVKRGAEVVKDMHELIDDHGFIRMATIKTFGQVTHTLIERKNYDGLFLPGYKKPRHIINQMLKEFPKPNLLYIDHAVGLQPEFQLNNIVDWYQKILFFDRYCSIDDKIVSTDYSGLNSIVICAGDKESIKMPIIEPTAGKLKGKSQVTEFMDYNSGPGIQHIALLTNDIVASAKACRQRGMDFMPVPPTYYKILEENLKHSKIKMKEDLETLKEYKIMVDYDEHGYLCQFFSRPVQDRPTFMIEVIQKINHRGFGGGNFKTIFQAIEMEQKERGNLFNEEEKAEYIEKRMDKYRKSLH